MKKWLLSCEHGGNHIPVEYSSAFVESKALLNSHRGFDIGVASLYKKLEKSGIFDFTIINEYSRLLIDFNRSPHHHKLYSEISNPFSEEIKGELLNNYYFPFRDKVKKIIFKWREKGFDVVHLSLHSFTPVLEGIQRNCDFGVLYDPSRFEEKKVAMLLKEKIKTLMPWWKVRFNYPYKGTSDGHVEFYRHNHPELDRHYAGLELELNQKGFESPIGWQGHFLAALKEVRGGF